MDVVRHTDPHRFLAVIDRDDDLFEARNNLVFGVAGTLIERPEVYETFYLWTVEDGGAAVIAAVMTPPYRLAICDAQDGAAIGALAAAVRDDLGTIPGAQANRSTAEPFAAAWTALTDTTAVPLFEQGVFQLEQVADVLQTLGRSRRAVPADEDLLVDWFMAFTAEALPHEEPDEAWTRRVIAIRLDDNPASGLWVWEVDGEPVSMSGYGGPTPNGARIGPVYTPPEQRGHGWATALVAEQSQWLLDNGKRFCFLFTDLANPTSNRIYERIGYRKVADAVDYRFTTPD